MEEPTKTVMLTNNPKPLIDSHVHIFPEKMMKAIFTFFHAQYQWDPPFSTNPEVILRDLENQGVNKSFCLAYAHKPGISRKLNSWLAGFSNSNPSIIPFGAVHPLDQDMRSIVLECLDQFRFPGMKLHCQVQQCSPDDERLNPLYESIIERSGGMIIHASSFPQPHKKYLGIDHISRLLKRFPDLNLIIPHLGLYELPGYRKLLEKYPGLYLDTAFVFQNGGYIPPVDQIVEMLLAFPDRIIYGSDYPFILEAPQNGINRILELGLPPESYRALFYDNAMNFLARITL